MFGQSAHLHSPVHWSPFFMQLQRFEHSFLHAHLVRASTSWGAGSDKQVVAEIVPVVVSSHPLSTSGGMLGWELVYPFAIWAFAVAFANEHTIWNSFNGRFQYGTGCDSNFSVNVKCAKHDIAAIQLVYFFISIAVLRKIFYLRYLLYYIALYTNHKNSKFEM